LALPNEFNPCHRRVTTQHQNIVLRRITPVLQT